MAGRLQRVGIEFLVQNWLPVLLAGLFLSTGIGCGAWAATGLAPGEVTHLNRYVDTIFLHLKPDRTEALRAALETNGLTIAGIYLSGLTIIGIPVIAGLLFVRGFALGFTAGFIIGQKGWQGVLIATAALLPQNLILVPVLVLASALAACFATALVRRIFNPRVPVATGLARYSLFMAVMALAALGCGFIEVLVTPQLLAAVLSLLNARGGGALP